MNGKWQLLFLLRVIAEGGKTSDFFLQNNLGGTVHRKVTALEKLKATDWLRVKFISCVHNGWKWACNTAIML